VPEAQGDFIDECAFASGMKTNALIATTITNLRRLSYIHAQSHAIVCPNSFKFLSRPYIGLTVNPLISRGIEFSGQADRSKCG
jgi:hypothetical protein